MEESTHLDKRPATDAENIGEGFDEIVLHFLRQSGVSVERFGQVYGLAIKGSPYTKARLYQMIQKKSFPTDPKRRWMLAKLLQIPPVLLGVSTLDDLLPGLQTKPSPAQPQSTLLSKSGVKSIDLKAYRQALKTYSTLHHTSTAVGSWNTINRDVNALEHALLYGKNEKQQWSKVACLLCGYHLLLSYIARDQQWYELAATHCDQAYGLARNEHLPDMQAAILQQRGCVFYSQACCYENRLDLDQAHHFFILAQADFQKALSFETALSPYPGLQGYLHIASGVTQAHIADHPSLLHTALKELDKAEKFIGQDNSFDLMHQCVALNVNESRYHLDRASVYINAPVRVARYPKDTQRELYWAIATQKNPNARRQQTLNTIFLAKSYLADGEYIEATRKARAALEQTKAIHSRANLDHIVALCRALQETDYGKNHLDVPALEIEITKVKYPELFQ